MELVGSNLVNFRAAFLPLLFESSTAMIEQHETISVASKLIAIKKEKYTARVLARVELPEQRDCIIFEDA